MKSKPSKILCTFKFTLLICALFHFIAWNTGCSSCHSEDEINSAYNSGYSQGQEIGYEKGKKDGYNQGQEIGYEKGKQEGYKQGYEIGYKKGYEKGKQEGYEIGYKKGYEKGEQDGYERGYKKGEGDGYKKGTSFFIGKWWKPSLGLVIIALIFIFTISALYYILRKPSKRLALQLEEKTENYLKHKKSNNEAEREIKIEEDRQKHRNTLRIQELFDRAQGYLREENAKNSLEKLRKEAKKKIQKAQVNDLGKIVESYKAILLKEIAKRGTKCQEDIFFES